MRKKKHPNGSHRPLLEKEFINCYISVEEEPEETCAANIFTRGRIPLKTDAVDWKAGYFFIAVDFKRDAALPLRGHLERRDNSFSVRQEWEA